MPVRIPSALFLPFVAKLRAQGYASGFASDEDVRSATTKKLKRQSGLSKVVYVSGGDELYVDPARWVQTDYDSWVRFSGRPDPYDDADPTEFGLTKIL